MKKESDQILERAKEVATNVLTRYQINTTGEQIEWVATWIASSVGGHQAFDFDEALLEMARGMRERVETLERALEAVTFVDPAISQHLECVPEFQHWMRDDPETYTRTVDGMRKMLEVAKGIMADAPALMKYEPKPKRARPKTYKGAATEWLSDALLDLGESSLWRISTIIADMLIEFGIEKSSRNNAVRAIYDRLHRRYQGKLGKLDKYSQNGEYS